MSGEMMLRQSEARATNGRTFEVNVSGRKSRRKKKKSLLSWGAMWFIILVVGMAAAIVGVGNLTPVAIAQRLLEETDVQYADMVESKMIVLQQALRDGEIPDDTAAILKEKGYTVGYVGEDGKFMEKNKAERELALYHDGEVITVENFVTAMRTDGKLYEAVKEATYDRAAAYYDEAADEIFSDLGTKRNNFSSKESFAEVMERVMGSGNAMDINSAEIVETATTDEEGNTVTTQGPGTMGEASRADDDTTAFIEKVRQKNPAANAEESAVKAGDTLRVADAVSQEQRSSLFYALFMENISKMKAGDGNESKIHETMNFLTTSQETEVVDTKTGKVIKVSGAPLEAPSLYALLAGTKADKAKVENYSEERVLKTIRNQTGGTEYAPAGETVASVENDMKGSIGTWVSNRSAVADAEVMQSVEPTIKASLVENRYKNLGGINAGELLAEGAVNLSRRLAQASGATAGDREAVAEYARVNENVLAMEAKAERETRSPLDITSRNTFLGSIVYNLAMVQIRYPEVRNLSGVIQKIGSVMTMAMRGLLPKSLAADTDEGYMTDYGECEVAGSIGAMATAGCSQIAVFDPSTLNDPFNNQGFVNFVEENTELDESGTRKVIPGSTLGNFIAFNVERMTPIGVMDGGILEALNGGGGADGGVDESLSEGATKIPFISDILAMIERFLGASDEDKRVASGAMYVNTSTNENWQEIKYAQRYVALARATAMLKEHSTDKTAYREMKYFEGEESPVVAYLREYCIVAKE